MTLYITTISQFQNFELLVFSDFISKTPSVRPYVFVRTYIISVGESRVRPSVRSTVLVEEKRRRICARAKV